MSSTAFISISKRTSVILALVCAVLVTYVAYTRFFGKEVIFYEKTNFEETTTKSISRDETFKVETTGKNIGFVFTGRWEFLRVQLPYLCRELRANGGALDSVIFMMIEYDKNTQTKLTEFAAIANKIYGESVFTFNYMGFDPAMKPNKRSRFKKFKLPFYEIVPEVVSHPQNKYFKFDDDIVYFHPGAISKLIQAQRSDCLIHFFNTAGSNWRCSWIHQEIGIYKDIPNPKNLKFGFNPRTNCGRRFGNCAKLALRAFLYHFEHNTLDKYFFDVEYISDRQRFTINAFMLDINTIDIKALLNSTALDGSDEEWWTEIYTSHSKRVNCIVGEALVVHFSYSMTLKEVMKANLLDDFVGLVDDNKHLFKLDKEIWQALDYH